MKTDENVVNWVYSLALISLMTVSLQVFGQDAGTQKPSDFPRPDQHLGHGDGTGSNSAQDDNPDVFNPYSDGSRMNKTGGHTGGAAGSDAGTGNDAGSENDANTADDSTSDTASCDGSTQSCEDYNGCDPSSQSCEQSTGKALPVGAETGADNVSKEEAEEENRRKRESFTGVKSANTSINKTVISAAIQAKKNQAITPIPEGAGTGADDITEAGARTKAEEIRKNFIDPQSPQFAPELDLEEGQNRLNEINGQKINIK